ncbi:hypothetical protein LTR84_000658 [Exophiala bonariae]|uniref:Uncharacterized protein n=1 Tax=Exophiala bonariae TaxID=1690606 RepID=A0AAV9NR85_9EURO|nr:hypothetical protein LTR84_000658 [Exophiala bonariae]
MVFNPTSPIRPFGRKPVIVSRTSTLHSEVASIGRGSEMSEDESPRSSRLSILPSWRGGMTKTNRQSQERQGHNPPQEVSRWSRTTTESEASEAIKPSKVSNPTPGAAKRMNVLKKKIKQRKVSKDTTASSPVDPLYDPKTRTLGLPDQEQANVVTSLVIGPITGPDEPRSFYDSGSDDSSDGEPVLQRASSVRVAKPLIVQHSNGSGGSIPKLYTSQSPASRDDSLVPKPLSVGLQLMNVNTPDHEDQALEETKRSVGGPQDALQALEGHLSAVSEATSEGSISPRASINKNILQVVDIIPGDEGMDIMPTPTGGFGLLRISKMSSDMGDSTNTYVGSSLDGLRSNPITDFDKKLSRAISAPARHPARRVTIRPADLVINHASNDHKLFRESIVSTPYPARQNSMVEFEDQPAPEVVTPRRLRRSKALSHVNKELNSTDSKRENEVANEKGKAMKEKDQPPRIPLSTKPTISSAHSIGQGLATSRSDRFPSPVAPEILFLDLRLGRHPAARVTVEIEVTDKATFDDEQLFNIIHKTYSTNLLGVVRGLLSARQLSHASLSNVAGTNDNIHTHRRFSPNTVSWYGHGQHTSTGAIDRADFARHLLHPALGRRRKIWLLWLRNQQYTGQSGRHHQQHRANRGGGGGDIMSHQPSALDDADSPVAFSFMHARNNSHSLSAGLGLTSKNNNNDISPTAATIAPSTAAGNLSRQVSTAASHNYTSPFSRPSITIPRMPFQPFSHSRDKSASSTTISSSSSRKPSLPHPIGPPTLYLHYRFSLRRILAVVALTVLAAIFATTMWILFGVPGRSISQGDGVGVGEYGGDVLVWWRRDTHKRVGVGLLLGFLVLFLGALAEALWVWGSWVLV